MKIFNTLIAVGLVSTAAFASGAFHVGAKLAGSYNMVWNVDNEITLTDIMKNLGVPADEIEEEMDGVQGSIKDANKLSGLGVGFGLTFRYQISDVLSIQPELLFNYRARSVEATVTGSLAGEDDDDYYSYYYDEPEPSRSASMKLPEIEVNQWFLDIPVLFRFQTGMGLFFNVGPVLSLNMDTEFKASIVSMDVDDYTTTIVFGGIAGLGYAIPLANGQTIDIDLRFHMGFSSIIRDDIEVDDEETSITLDGTKIIDPMDFNISLGISYWFI